MGVVSTSWSSRYVVCSEITVLVVLMGMLFLLAVNVHMPRDRITQSHQNYGFVEFMGEEDADYAIKIMNMIKVYGKPIRVNKVGKNSLLLLNVFSLTIIATYFKFVHVGI